MMILFTHMHERYFELYVSPKSHFLRLHRKHSRYEKVLTKLPYDTLNYQQQHFSSHLKSKKIFQRTKLFLTNFGIRNRGIEIHALTIRLLFEQLFLKNAALGHKNCAVIFATYTEILGNFKQERLNYYFNSLGRETETY
jgi:hypothetical protein